MWPGTSRIHGNSQAQGAVLQGIVERYKGSAILEVQARSCEYSHMFKLDGMRAALLEHIPPLDESTYTRNLGNSQVIDAAGAAQVTPQLVCRDQCLLALTVLLVQTLCASVMLIRTNTQPTLACLASQYISRH